MRNKSEDSIVDLSTWPAYMKPVPMLFCLLSRLLWQCSAADLALRAFFAAALDKIRGI